MRFARFLTVALMSAAILAGCADTSAGWTYAPGAIAHASRRAAPLARGERARRIGEPGRGRDQCPRRQVRADRRRRLLRTPRSRSRSRTRTPGTPHNVALHLGDVNGAELFKGEVFAGVATRVYDVPALDAGSYAFVCTVHPTMIGTLTVK